MNRFILFGFIFALLILNTSKVFAKDSSIDKQLFLAVQLQDIPQLKTLLTKGANPNYMENGRSLLGWASQGNNVEVVDTLLNAGAKPNEATDSIGHTPLMRAIDTRQVEIVQRLLKAKADPNAQTPDGKTCLIMAIESTKLEILKALISAGADVKYTSDKSDPPMLIATQSGSVQSVEMIKILASAGADINASNIVYTPLSYAIEQGNKELLSALLEAGANPNLKTKSDQYPIELALNNAEILDLLLKSNAEPNITLNSGGTPLHEAIRYNQVPAIKLLLDAGADTKRADSSGRGAMELAEGLAQAEIIELLKSKDNSQTSSDKNDDPKLASIHCDITAAAKKQMEIHGLLQAQVDAGKLSSDIFRTFNEDTKDYGRLLVEDPSEACRLFERLRVKYGV